MSDNLKDKAAFLGGGIIGLLFWICTGGMMLLHLASFFVGATSFLFMLIGSFVPPIGIVNGFVFLTTGDGLQQYF